MKSKFYPAPKKNNPTPVCRRTVLSASVGRTVRYHTVYKRQGTGSVAVYALEFQSRVPGSIPCLSGLSGESLNLIPMYGLRMACVGAQELYKLLWFVGL